MNRQRPEESRRAQRVHRSSGGRVLLLALLLIAGTIVAYWPSLGGGFLWDDPDYVVNNLALRNLRGLWWIWTSIFSLPQWYPMVHTSYWLEYQLFGLNPLVFRVNNLLLHIATALLLWKLLRTLEVPGAYLAAVVFALHPVHVESVAWITERKNTLSGLFYIAAFLTYWSWSHGGQIDGSRSDADPPRDGPSGISGGLSSRRSLGSDAPAGYWLALGLFLAALLSKTVTATFPAAMLVVLWWKSGRVTRRDVLPLLPFFAAGVVMGLITAYLERHHVGAIGAEWDYSPTWYGELAARTIIAAKALWFYAGKLLWPYPLAFMYDRWSIDVSDWRQWSYVITAFLLILGLLLLRQRIGRGPLAAVLLFGGTLFPALGYFNVYPHRYSFVADHFQHLASVALTTLGAAAINQATLWLGRDRASVVANGLVTGLIGTILATLTFRQAGVYRSPLTLWQDTAVKSPRSWVAFTNLGKALHDAGDIQRSKEAHMRALELAPHVGDTWYNIGAIYASEAQWEKAADAFARARDLAARNRKNSSVYLDATLALGRIAFYHRGDAAAGERFYREALAIRPDYAPALVLLAILCEDTGRPDEAYQHYLAAIEADPNNFEARYNLGNILMKLGHFREAAEQFSVAVAARPESAEAWANFGWAQLRLGARPGAIRAFERALALNRDLQQAKTGLEQARSSR
ncbi:MAG: tetratricopeptide repeat protein [Phycisphaerae bacterium]|nr:tetratricopeptide repeat protein [Phycisphaerae bacterium]MDW8262318.1 tetratricopeptide repeat protein [Phycisphaerales bacterium]